MKLDQLQTKLIAAARAAQPSDHVPYAFEKRIMARLSASARVDALGAWSVALWRAAMGCVAIVVLSGALSFWTNQPAHEAEFSHEFESAVLASADAVDEAW